MIDTPAPLREQIEALKRPVDRYDRFDNTTFSYNQAIADVLALLPVEPSYEPIEAQALRPCPTCGTAHVCVVHTVEPSADSAQEIVEMPRHVLVGLAGDDPQKQELLAAWDTENELRHAAEARVDQVTQERDELTAEIAAAREACPLVRRQDYFDAPLLTLIEHEISQLFQMQSRAEKAEATHGTLLPYVQHKAECIVWLRQQNPTLDAQLARLDLSAPDCTCGLADVLASLSPRGGI
jgi:hypothetical protein